MPYLNCPTPTTRAYLFFIGPGGSSPFIEGLRTLAREKILPSLFSHSLTFIFSGVTGDTHLTPTTLCAIEKALSTSFSS